MNQAKFSKQQLAQFREVLEQVLEEKFPSNINLQINRIEQKTDKLLEILTSAVKLNNPTQRKI